MPTPGMFGVQDISGWVPDFGAGYEQLRAQAGRLKALRGQRIEGTWAVLGTNGSHERWWNDLPVILQFTDGQQLEVCWDYRDRLSVSWNTIDVSVTPGRWRDYSLTWRQDGQPELSGVRGGVLTDVAGLEQAYWRGGDIDPGNPDFDIAGAAGWDAHGIWLQTSQAGVRIFSWVDGNGLGNEPQGACKDWRLFTLLLPPSCDSPVSAAIVQVDQCVSRPRPLSVRVPVLRRRELLELRSSDWLIAVEVSPEA